jgi:hypothetical protein
MSAQQTGAERANSKTIERWSAYLEKSCMLALHTAF